jgi:thiol-disulfide isomerase/thioredoxin
MRLSHPARWPRGLALAVLLLGSAAAAEAPPVRAVTADQLRAEMTALRGRVVMLNVWATWCAPCLKEIPDLVTIESELGAHGLVLVGLSVDEPEDSARVDGFRRKYFPAFRSLLRGSSDMDAVVSVVDPAWNEVVPTTYLIGRDGKTFSRIQGKRTLAQFRESALEALAAK